MFLPLGTYYDSYLGHNLKKFYLIWENVSSLSLNGFIPEINQLLNYKAERVLPPTNLT